MTTTKEFDLTIPDDAWKENFGIDDPRNCLYVTLNVNGLPMHFEAWEVTVDEDGIQEAVGADYGDSFEQLHSAVSADGGFNTVEIQGRTYILVATPFC